MFKFRDGQYSLSTESGSNKTVLFVKLTDSALNSIENLLQAKDEETKPTIQFEGNNGTITLPQNGQKIFYGFTLSNLKADGSSFQCLQHTTKKSLKSLASMHIKMQVHANEDSYAHTKCKMEAVEKEQKSLCVKEIKTNGKCLSKKSIFKHPGNVFPLKQQGSALSPKHPGGVFPIKAVPFVKAQEHSGFLKPREISNKSMLSKEPIRKRIIHILAVKSFKKPEIILKLKKDGISNEDMYLVSEILEQVAVCKDKVYTLLNHLWNEVEDDWKFYSTEELEIIHRKKQNHLELNGISASKKQNNVKKINVNKSESLDEPQSKKQRLSLNNNHKVKKKDVKNCSPELKSVSKVKTNGVLNDMKTPSLNQVNGHSKNVGLSNETSPQFDLEALLNRKSPELYCDPLSNGKGSKKELVEALMKLAEEDRKQNPSKYESPKTPDCVSPVYIAPKLVKITSAEERAKYAERFNTVYTDYLKLHKRIKEISDKVLEIDSQMKNCEKGSEDYKLHRRELMKIYKETALSCEYRLDWDKFHYYQKMLEDIKKLVRDYDNEAS